MDRHPSPADAAHRRHENAGSPRLIHVRPLLELPDGEDEPLFSAEQFFKETYGQLKRGALVTTIMSSLTFVMGLAFLVIAAIQSIQGAATDVAIVLASSGLVSIAAAFYRSPVAQIRQVAADVQQSSMVLMSYMLGLSLLSKSLSGRETTADRQALASLTGELIDLLPSCRAADHR